jgi:tetratricopeptide (TPR) repeat protein
MKKIILFVAALIGTSVITTIVYHKTQKADINYYHGYRYFEKNNYGQAIAWYEKVLNIDPWHEKALREAAYAYQWTGQYEKAALNFEKVLSLRPDDNKIKKSLAETYSWKKEYEKAIPLYKEVIDATGDIAAERQLAEVYVWNKNYEDAVKSFKEVLKHEPGDTKIKAALADVLSWQKEYDEAVLLYKDIITATGDINIKRQLAEVYIWTNRFDPAKDILEAIVEANPKDFEAKLLLAKALHYSGDINKASLIYEELIKEKRLVGKAEEIEARSLLGAAYMADKNYEDSIRQFREILKAAPDNVGARASLADILSWQKKYDESIAEYAKILEIEPFNLKIREKLAGVYTWKKDYENAENLYKDIIKQDPQNLGAYASLAEILTWEKRYEEAIAYFKIALSQKGDKGIEFSYGQALLFSGDYERAKDVLNNAIGKDPENVEAKTYLADAFAYTEKFDRAISLYKEILQRTSNVEVKRKLADTLSWAKKYNEAIALYDEIFEENTDITACLQKARVLGWARRYNESLKEYQKILDFKYDELIELEMKGKKAYWNNHVKSALSYYEELMEKDPENLETMFDACQIYSYQSMWAEAIKGYKNILSLSPNHFRAQEALRKADYISSHISLKTGYEFFEADSTDRVADIRKNVFFNKAHIPLDYHLTLAVDYKLADRSFSDFGDVMENEGRLTLIYTKNPEGWAEAFYDFIGYNKDIDPLHTFGGKINIRFFDMGIASLSCERKRLDNSSRVIKGRYYSDNLEGRLYLDITKRLKLGMDFLASDYSDDNYSQESGFDMLYYLSLEPRRFSVKYKADNKDFNKKSEEYFSPEDFWLHTFTLNWRHFLNKEEVFWGADDLYYDLACDISLDSGDIPGYAFSAELNWDINKRLNFNMRGAIADTSSSVYKEKSIISSIKYWF